MEIKNKTLKAIYESIPLMEQKDYIAYFKVLGDEVRHLVCKQIFLNPGITGKEILVKFNVSQPTLSFHIAQLIKAKLIFDNKRGQSHYYYPNYSRVLSFQKTAATYQSQIDTFIGDVYKTIIACITKGQCSGECVKCRKENKK